MAVRGWVTGESSMFGLGFVFCIVAEAAARLFGLHKDSGVKDATW